MTFQDSMSSGACCNALDHLYSYTICDVDLATRAAALNPPNCLPGESDGDGDSDSGSGDGDAMRPRGTTPDLARTRLITVRRAAIGRHRIPIQHSPTTGRNPT
jgi:hypothetical protein